MKKSSAIISAIVLAALIAGAVIALNKPSVSPADSGSNASANPIVIGAVISLTGPAASFGEYAKNGMDLAASEINAAGGIDGRQVRIIYEDDQTNPKSAVSAFTKLTSIDNANAVIGGLWDFVAQPMLPLALNSKTTLITPTQFRIEGGFEFNANSFSMLTDFSKVIRGVTSYLKRDDVQKIAVVHFKSTFGTEIAKTIAQVTKEIGKGVIIDEAYTAFDTNDFKTTIAKLKQQHVDTVFLDMVDKDTVNFLMRSKELGFTSKMITYAGSYDGFTADNRSLLEGITVLNWEASTPAFIARYHARFNADSAKSANRSYDAVYVLAEAIAKTGNNADVSSYIESHAFSTANGPITFLPTHQVSTTPVELDTYKNGALIPF
ncbi:MAG: Extracellular ligand-binding receptor [Candidatus Taylorbacteria bacterium]|nr:Extracellular ligand-binding receptor [Candidatus Taylorbacteria bacterium]